MGIIATKGFQYRGVPKDLIAHLRQHHRQLDTFVETGTNIGATAYWASEVFKQVVTIEFAQELYDRLDQSRKNIRFVLGDSSEMMPSLLSDHAIVYLDAHYSSGETHNSYPLLKELKHVNGSGLKDLVVIVDDARFCSATWNDETYGELPEVVGLLSNGGQRYVTLMDDMLVAVPREMEKTVRDFYNKRSKELWAQYEKDSTPNVVKAAAKKLLGR
ncbi:MAG: hypothetical protein KBH07_02855 [Flavobacteriales bacterium]|nr:hypothetical protein [Flavobacteriales bacterium]MBP9080946.1 hypothetical protein [Flavobacteriales bacterium]